MRWLSDSKFKTTFLYLCLLNYLVTSLYATQFRQAISSFAIIIHNIQQSSRQRATRTHQPTIKDSRKKVQIDFFSRFHKVKNSKHLLLFSLNKQFCSWQTTSKATSIIESIPSSQISFLLLIYAKPTSKLPSRKIQNDTCTSSPYQTVSWHLFYPSFPTSSSKKRESRCAVSA